MLCRNFKNNWKIMSQHLWHENCLKCRSISQTATFFLKPAPPSLCTFSSSCRLGLLLLLTVYLRIMSWHCLLKLSVYECAWHEYCALLLCINWRACQNVFCVFFCTQYSFSIILFTLSMSLYCLNDPRPIKICKSHNLSTMSFVFYYLYIIIIIHVPSII